MEIYFWFNSIRHDSIVPVLFTFSTSKLLMYFRSLSQNAPPPVESLFRLSFVYPWVDWNRFSVTRSLADQILVSLLQRGSSTAFSQNSITPNIANDNRESQRRAVNTAGYERGHQRPYTGRPTTTGEHEQCVQDHQRTKGALRSGSIYETGGGGMRQRPTTMEREAALVAGVG